MTLIIGSEGSMGRRYQAILKYLNKPFQCYDLKTGGHIRFEKYDNFIIATPTETHFRWIQNLDELGKPILCEKPLSTDMDEVRGIVACKSPLSMMMQYMHYYQVDDVGPSWYRFYNHGKDGLVWDCFQIIALANYGVDLSEDSPIWTCGLNGRRLSLDDMDAAYMWAVMEFLDGKYIDKTALLKWHQKVAKYEASCKLSA